MYTVTQPERVEVIDDTGLYLTRQSYDQQLTVILDQTHRLRVTVHRDMHYDFQSSFRAERWNGSTWKEIAHVPALSARGTGMPKSIGPDGLEPGGPAHTAVDALIEHLIFAMVAPTLGD